MSKQQHPRATSGVAQADDHLQYASAPVVPRPFRRLTDCPGNVHQQDRASPDLEAFKALVNKCLSLVEGHNAVAIVRFVNRSLERVEISNALRYDLRRWLGNKNHPIQSRPAHAEELRRVTSLLHVGFHEFLGPAGARQLLSRAMEQVRAEGGACDTALSRLI